MDQLLKLKKILLSFNQVVISFSGGIDSTLLAYYANETLGRENVYVVIGNSPLHKETETEDAIKLAEKYHFQYHVVELDELNCSAIRHNTLDSWYYSKKILYQAVEDFAYSKNILTVCDGMILDDLKDYRPGLRARDELDVKSPLIEAGFDKQLVRDSAQLLNISSWNKIPSCSLISRFPYDSEITMEAINKIKQTEQLLNESGFDNPRARYYQSLVKIELVQNQIPKFLEEYKFWNQKIKTIGFNHVALDLEGYHYGNMNSTIKRKE